MRAKNIIFLPKYYFLQYILTRPTDLHSFQSSPVKRNINLMSPKWQIVAETLPGAPPAYRSWVIYDTGLGKGGYTPPIPTKVFSKLTKFQLLQNMSMCRRYNGTCYINGPFPKSALVWYSPIFFNLIPDVTEKTPKFLHLAKSSYNFGNQFASGFLNCFCHFDCANNTRWTLGDILFLALFFEVNLDAGPVCRHKNNIWWKWFHKV